MHEIYLGLPMENELILILENESAKLRALCALVPHVLSCLTCSRALCALVPRVPRGLRALES